MNEFQEKKVKLTWHEPKKNYDVIIIGGGGHGLSTAYFLATRHNVTNVLVIEKGYIGGGNSGRNTTIIRADYGMPESMAFYKRSLDLYYQLEEETDRWIMFKPKGMVRLAHSVASFDGAKKRAKINRIFGAESNILEPHEVQKLVPEVDMSGGGKYPVVGALHHVPASTARHDRVNWALAEGANSRGAHILQRTTVLDLLKSADNSKKTSHRSPTITTIILYIVWMV